MTSNWTRARHAAARERCERATRDRTHQPCCCLAFPEECPAHSDEPSASELPVYADLRSALAEIDRLRAALERVARELSPSRKGSIDRCRAIIREAVELGP